MSEENLYTFENPEYRKTYWHTCSHIMAQAVKRLWPEVQLAIGPAIDEGWYYDFDAPFTFTPEHLEQIRKAAAEFAGKDFAQAIILCPIGERYHFLSGCTYLIQTGFYQRGGLCS